MTNRRKVEEATGGRVGYIHIPDMGANGIREFIKWYYPQIRKEGLVVDVRANGGGNVSRMLIERLRRKAAGAQLLAHRRRSQHLSRRRLHRTDGGAAGCRTRLRTATSSRACSAKPDLGR